MPGDVASETTHRQRDTTETIQSSNAHAEKLTKGRPLIPELVLKSLHATTLDEAHPKEASSNWEIIKSTLEGGSL
jgi:hypothetical protein